MRTTLSLDADVHTALLDAAYKSGRSFEVTVNDAIRGGMREQRPGTLKPAPPEWPTYNLGVPRVDLTKANSLAAELEDLG